MKVLHLGIGRFHRAHQAWVYHHANQDIEVYGVSLRSKTVKDELAPRGFQYNLWIKDQNESVHEISVLKDVLFLSEEREKILELSQDIGLISLTVTEKGYLLEGELIYSLLSEILKKRKTLNKGLVLLSCDNVSHNGEKFKTNFNKFLANDLELKNWMNDYCEFPSTMVDRIVPATTDEDRSEFQRKFQIVDQGVVTTEEFCQWFIEDLPQVKSLLLFEGIEWCSNIDDVEKMKLRLLNAAHSYLAYEGQLRGFTYVHEAINDGKILEVVKGIWSEARETINDFGTDLSLYCESLIKRFQNPHLNHKLAQIGMDGSQKIQFRFLGSYKERENKGLQSPNLSKALDSWFRFVQREIKANHQLNDPFFDNLESAQKKFDNLENLLSRL